MAKIDVTLINGYADMTAEEKLKALESFDLPDPDFTGYVKKDLFDKKASELAEANRKLNEKLSDEEKEKQEKEQKMADLEQEIANLKKEKLINSYKAQFLAQGMDEKLAKETAEALEKGDNEKVFANQKAFLDAFEKRIRTDALGDLDKPPMGDDRKPGEESLAKTLGAKKAAALKTAKEGLKNFK